MILSFTVLTRNVTTDATCQLRPFWSYGVPELREQIIWNMIGFVPVGFLGGMLLRCGIIPIAMGFSLCLELLQFITHRGLFEFDDVIHNTVGTIIGFLIWVFIRRLNADINQEK